MTHSVTCCRSSTPNQPPCDQRKVLQASVSTTISEVLLKVETRTTALLKSLWDIVNTESPTERDAALDKKEYIQRPYLSFFAVVRGIILICISCMAKVCR